MIPFPGAQYRPIVFFVALVVTALSCSDNPTGPDSTPTLSTCSATPLIKRKAVLAGWINPMGKQTTYHFEYGPDSSYGFATPLRDLGPTIDDHFVSDTLTELRPGAEYHFRLVSQNSAGFTRGPDSTFLSATEFTFPIFIGKSWTYDYSFYFRELTSQSWGGTSILTVQSYEASDTDTTWLLQDIQTLHKRFYDGSGTLRDSFTVTEISWSTIVVAEEMVTVGFSTGCKEVSRYFVPTNGIVNNDCSGGGYQRTSTYVTGIGLTESHYQTFGHTRWTTDRKLISTSP